MSKYLVKQWGGLLLLLALSSQATAENVIIVKAGNYTMDDTTQRIDLIPSPVNTTFEDDVGVFGVQYEFVFNNGFSIGGGFEGFTLDYTSGIGSGQTDVIFVTANPKYYFLDGDFRPFLGGSVGLAATDFTGSIDGTTSGLALGFQAGFRYQFSLVGVYVEYKNYFSAKTEDSENADVDLAGSIISAGLSFAF